MAIDWRHMLEAIKRFIAEIARDVYYREWEHQRSTGFYKWWRHHPLVYVQLDEGAHLPVRFYPTDAGADIMCVESFTVPARSSRVINTGVHVEIPENTVMMLKAKSGLNVKARLLTDGTIDEGYTGPIKVCVYNHGDYPYTFRAGQAVTQMVLLPVLYPKFVEIDEIRGGERGDRGFGSTGK